MNSDGKIRNGGWGKNIVEKTKKSTVATIQGLGLAHSLCIFSDLYIISFFTDKVIEEQRDAVTCLWPCTEANWDLPFDLQAI